MQLKIALVFGFTLALLVGGYVYWIYSSKQSTDAKDHTIEVRLINAADQIVMVYHTKPGPFDPSLITEEQQPMIIRAEPGTEQTITSSRARDGKQVENHTLPIALWIQPSNADSDAVPVIIGTYNVAAGTWKLTVTADTDSTPTATLSAIPAP